MAAKILTVSLVLVAVVLPLGIYIVGEAKVEAPEPLMIVDRASRYPQSQLEFVSRAIGSELDYSARITNVQIVDFDRDGHQDILVCDAVRNSILLYRNDKGGNWQEQQLVASDRFSDPAHATVVDLDQDNDSDIVVSVLGSLFPEDVKSGRVELLVNEGDGEFSTRVLLDDLRRIADVQPGDLDEDGDLDLVVAEFGYERGRILWLENDGKNVFTDHLLMMVPGTVHVPISDYDNDGDLDVAAIVTQDEEEIWIFENLDGPGFKHKRHRVFHTPNFDIGGAGMVSCDLDQDGDQDLLLAYGDNLELVYHYPQPYHGCIWLENQGGLSFVPHRIGDLGGTYAVAPADLDSDGDIDVVLASMFNDWRSQGSASLVWLENDGKQNFTSWQIADAPSHLSTVACGDLNGDGKPDIVAGAMHTYEPFDRLGRITAWLNGIERSSNESDK